ncbi:metallophosphoesterase [Microbacterium sp. A1-JK]|uniref:metallophosphoesterase n=1 Tax=Microbacterium sp. A1-JK TaxID=3177516 RepID=UPI003886D9E1
MARFRTAGRVLAAGVAFGVIAASGVLVATAPASAASVPAAERYAPHIVPDRITLLPGADPTTQQVVSWRSSTGVRQGVIEYRTMTAEPYPGGIVSLDAQQRVEQVTKFGYTNVVHTATLSGLRPGVTYMYRVGDGTNFSEWQDFDTSAADDADTFSFLYFGDVQNGILSDASRVVRNAFRDRPNADLVLQIGDLVNDAEADDQWGELYEAFSYGLGTQELLTTPGNHEYEGRLSPQWDSMYTYPDNGPQGEGSIYDELDGTVYYTDHEGVRFISLNSNVSSTEGLKVQGDWLQKVLDESTQQWTVVYFHHPVYSLDEGRNNLGIRQQWGPILERNNVDLVLNGHDHAYGRGNLLANEKNLPAGADPELSSTGPVYVTSSVGSKFYNAGPRHWNENEGHLRRLEAGLQTYQMIDVSGGTMRFESRTADGAFFDGFTITKSGDTKLVVDGVEPQVIDPGTPSPCLGCENPNPTDPTDPTDPEVPAGEFDYEQTAQLDAVMPNGTAGASSTAALPAGVAYDQKRDVLYLGDQNGRKIFEIDPDTDAVLREMTLPENIRDLGIDEENKLLYVGQQNKNWVVVSIADETFGQVVRGPYPIIESQRSIDVDPKNDYVYVAVPARGVEVFRASTGQSLGVINGTKDSYYVAADPQTGTIVTTKFQGVPGTPDLQAFAANDGFSLVWEKEVRAGARQVDIDSEHGLLYVGYTGTSADRGGFSVHALTSGASLVDKVGPEFGKDGYGIVVDEEDQRVFVANRDFRLNPPGEELVPFAVTESTRIAEPEAETFAYEKLADLDSVMPNSSTDAAHKAALPAGVAYDQKRDVLYLGDQNSRQIFEIDPDSDQVRRSMTLPENIRDLGIDEDKQLLYVGQQNKNWIVVSIADETFGQVVRGPYPIIESQRSIDVDPKNDYVYVAVPARGVEVFRASTGQSLGVINGTKDSYYVAADPQTGTIVTTKFQGVPGTPDLQAFAANDGFSLVWEKEVRAGARQVDIDSEHGLLYVGYTGTSADRGGFSVHALTSGASLVDKVGPEFGKDGYGIVVDEEDQRVFVANRDFRLNPPGEELEPKAVTVSIRTGDGEPTEPEEPTDPEEPTEPEVPTEDPWTATALAAIPTATAEGATEIRPVGSAVDPATGLVYLADEQRPARVHVVDPKTDTIVRTLSAPTTDPVKDGLRDIAFDAATGHLTVAFGDNWVVMDAQTGARVAGPFAFSSGGVRGMDVDFAGGRVFAGLRGSGFDVRDAATGALIRAVEAPADGGAWRTHGVAYDAVNDLIYVSNSDTAESTQGIRVYSGADYSLVDTLDVAGADFRSIAVDPATDTVVVGHQSTTFDNSGVSIYHADGLGLVERLEEHRYGNKVYGVSIDPKTHRLYVSARDRYPSGLVRVTLPAALPEPEVPVEPWIARGLTAIPTEGEEPQILPVGTTVDPATGDLFVANEMRPARIHIVDPVADVVKRTIVVPEGLTGDGLRDIAYDAANKVLYVAYGSNWVVLNAETGAVVRGPFAFSGGVRGMDVDLGRGLVYGGTRGTGFDVADANTGELKQTVAGVADGGAWRTHGVAYDAASDLLYISNSDASGSTEGIRVYGGADLALQKRQSVANADYRSIAVDGGLVVVGNQSTTFEQSGATVFSASDLSVVRRLSAHAYGNKVYGVSIDADRDLLYVSARDRYPTGLIQVTLPKS